jgi:heme/copper-type cytochrome/quinol oxidase subunit 1
MLNLTSIMIGLFALLIALVGIIPFPLVPMLNWIAFPIAVVGAVIGMLSRGTAGRNLNLLVMAISGLRLFLTGGLI